MSDSSLSFTQRGVRPVNKLICLTLASVALMMLDSALVADIATRRMTTKPG